MDVLKFVELDLISGLNVICRRAYFSHGMALPEWVYVSPKLFLNFESLEA